MGMARKFTQSQDRNRSQKRTRSCLKSQKKLVKIRNANFHGKTHRERRSDLWLIEYTTVDAFCILKVIWPESDKHLSFSFPLILRQHAKSESQRLSAQTFLSSGTNQLWLNGLEHWREGNTKQLTKQVFLFALQSQSKPFITVKSVNTINTTER